MKTLNDYFSKIYYINLDSRPDRYNECLLEFRKMNINVERVSGIDGSKLYMGSDIKRTSGAHGLLLTHIKILEDAILNNYKNILILEDDVKFLDIFYEKFNEKIIYLPDDWDLLCLGGINAFEVGGFKSMTGDKDFIPTMENFKTLDYELCRTHWTQTTHAIAINSKFYNALLNKYRENKINAIDSIICFLQREGNNAYTFLPSIAIQRPSFSNIENNFVDYSNRF